MVAIIFTYKFQLVAMLTVVSFPSCSLCLRIRGHQRSEAHFTVGLPGTVVSACLGRILLVCAAVHSGQADRWAFWGLLHPVAEVQGAPMHAMAGFGLFLCGSQRLKAGGCQACTASAIIRWAISLAGLSALIGWWRNRLYKIKTQITSRW